MKRLAKSRTCVMSLFALVACSGCDSDSELSQSTVCQELSQDLSSSGAWPLIDLGPGADLSSHPFPSDIRFPPGTRPDVSDFPNRYNVPMIEETKSAITASRTGAGLTAGFTIVFDAPPDISTWPEDPLATVEPDSPLLLIELASNDSRSGRLIPFRWRYLADEGPYNNADTLRVVPDWGFALEPNARYAFAIRTASGVERSPVMKLLLAGCKPPGPLGVQARAVVSDALAELQGLGFDSQEWAYLQVFTTDDPVEATATVIADTFSRVSVPELMDVEQVSDDPDFCRLKGLIPLPQYQAGNPPFLFGGGQWVFDQNGALVPQREELVPFSLILPKGEMPASGWPLVVVVLGTGQTHEWFLESEAVSLMGIGTRGFAGATKANPLHPDREYPGTGWETYNYPHPVVFRDNLRQSVIEQALFLRALLNTSFDPTLCPGSDASAASDGRIRFNGDRVGASGQSLGSLILHNWASVEPLLGAIAPTGAGAYIPIWLANPEEANLPVQLAVLIVRILLRLPSDSELDPLGPTSFIGQMALETVDPVGLSSRVVRNPLPGMGAKHWYYPAGYHDSFFQADGIKSLVGPIGAELAGTPVHESLVDLADRLGRHAPSYPVALNVVTPEGPRTSVVVQFFADGYDGHGVVYREPGAQHQFGCFFQTYFETGVPTVPAPGDSLDSCSTQ